MHDSFAVAAQSEQELLVFAALLLSSRRGSGQSNNGSIASQSVCEDAMSSLTAASRYGWDVGMEAWAAFVTVDNAAHAPFVPATPPASHP